MGRTGDLVVRVSRPEATKKTGRLKLTSPLLIVVNLAWEMQATPTN